MLLLLIIIKLEKLECQLSGPRWWQSRTLGLESPGSSSSCAHLPPAKASGMLLWPPEDGLLEQRVTRSCRKPGSSRLPSTSALINTLLAEASRQGTASQNWALRARAVTRGTLGTWLHGFLAGGWTQVSESGSDRGLASPTWRVPGSAGKWGQDQRALGRAGPYTAGTRGAVWLVQACSPS